MADTIAAVATAPAVSAIGIIRLSGQDALAIAKRVFFASLDLAARPREMIYGKITDISGTLLDSGLAVYMKAPASYTGEDTVEFFSHGSPIVIREIMAALCRAGARSALPGEYTRRAFLNKKMDLTQAEAVIDLIDSETVAAARNAAAQMQGGMGKKITASRDKLLDIAASFYAYVDYPDEEIDELECNSMIDILTTVAKELVCLADSFNTGRILKSGVRCAIIGRPNAGKSSVLNELLGFERSIVSPIAGTTRDTVEESARVGDIALHLIDTAGLRECDDAIEKMGVARSRAAAQEAQLVLAVFDGACELCSEDLEVLSLARGRHAIAIINKSDMAMRVDINAIKDVFGDNFCIVSAQESTGFDALDGLVSRMFNIAGVQHSDGMVVTNVRHAEALRSAGEITARAADTLKNGFTPDVAAQDIEEAINALGELTGETASSQIIERIFTRFCVGK